MNFLKGRLTGVPARKSYNLDELKAEIVDKVSSAIMMVDRDFIVTYVNQPTMELLRKNADAFRTLSSSFDPEKIIGCCIDTFHKNPAHQRKMLADPSRLPFKTEITVGDLKISLGVSGSFDRNGNYVGNILEWQDVTSARLNEGMLAAIDKAQAVISFSLDGKVLTANDNFLKTLGYSLDEIKGQHHGMFVEPSYRQSAEYRIFWEKLGRGEYDAAQYKRIGKGGREVWIQASYNPIMDMNGKPFKVVKYATDVTAQVMANQALQLAVQQSQDVIAAAKDNDLSKALVGILNAARATSGAGALDRSTPAFKEDNQKLAKDLAAGVITPEAYCTALDASAQTAAGK